MNKRRLGAAYEELAAEYLEKKGYRILERNFRCRAGEIDLIAIDGRYLVFVEVKYRRDASMGTAAEAVDFRKQNVIRKAATWYLSIRQIPENTPCRFDVMGITGKEVCLIKDAFS